MSPERLDQNKFGLKENHLTKESDCYVLGMVTRSLAGRYHVLYNRLVVVQETLDGERPKNPQGAQGAWFTTDLWRILDLCWKPQQGDRPGLNTVLRCLQDVTPPSKRGWKRGGRY